MNRILNFFMLKTYFYVLKFICEYCVHITYTFPSLSFNLFYFSSTPSEIHDLFFNYSLIIV